MFNEEDYKENIKDHLPQGVIWTREKGTNVDSLYGALAVEMARVDSRVEDLLRESYPLLANELLADWERVTGLPEPCVGAPDTLDARRKAVFEKLGRKGGSSLQYFIDLAGKYGFTITITEYRRFRSGWSHSGDAIWGGGWEYAFRINAPATTITTFKSGQNASGDPIRYWGNELLECIINRLKQAHTIAIFSYGA